MSQIDKGKLIRELHLFKSRCETAADSNMTRELIAELEKGLYDARAAMHKETLIGRLADIQEQAELTAASPHLNDMFDALIADIEKRC